MSNVTTDVNEQDIITKVVRHYTDGARSGKGEAVGRFELAEVDTPEPGAEETLISVKATNINPIDNKLLHQHLD